MFGGYPGKDAEPCFTLRVELAMLLREHQHRHADCFKNSEFFLVLAYIVDIFDALNNLNQQMQGVESTLSKWKNICVVSLHEYTGLLKNNNKYSQKSLSLSSFAVVA